MLTTLKAVLAKAHKGNYAVGAFNTNNLEITLAVIEAAVEMKSPVIIQTSEGAVEYAGMEYLKAMILTAAKSKVPVVFHLDHGKDLKVVSTTNGNDTSDQIDDDDADGDGVPGLLNGILGDNSIIGSSNLLGGGLLNGAL